MFLSSLRLIIKMLSWPDPFASHPFASPFATPLHPCDPFAPFAPFADFVSQYGIRFTRKGLYVLSEKRGIKSIRKTWDFYHHLVMLISICIDIAYIFPYGMATAARDERGSSLYFTSTSISANEMVTNPVGRSLGGKHQQSSCFIIFGDPHTITMRS